MSVSMLRRLYDWVIRLASSPQAIPAMGVVAFAESSFFPIPPDIMLIPMVLANRTKAFRIALVCTVCSVLGGLLGYAIGYYFFETIGAWLVKTYGLQTGLESFRHGFAEYGTWIILIKGLTPIPYKLVTIASGAAHFDLFTLVFALLAITALFVTAGIGVFHVGVEYHWWQGPQACSGRVPAGLSDAELKKFLLGARMVRCDEPAWKMWDISMAGWNAILSASLAIVLAMGVARHIRERA